MSKLREKMIAYLSEHPIDFGYSDADTVIEFLYDAFCEARESEPSEIRELSKQLSPYLEKMPREENDAMFGIIIKMCIAHERNAFKEGFWLGLKLDTEN